LKRQPVSSNPDPRPAADPGGYATRPRWLWRELDWRGGLAANSLAGLFALVSLAAAVSLHWPGVFDARQFLAAHFELTPENLAAGRPYCLLTHAFLSVGSLPHTLLLFAGFVLFGYAAERRVGPGWLLAVFVAATVAGGAAELAAGSVGGHTAVDSLATGAGSMADAVANVLNRLLHGRAVVSGPAAAVAAFLTVAVLVRPDDESRWDNLWVALAGVALVAADSRAVIGEAAGGAVAASRAVGVLVGLLAVAARAVARRDFGATWPARFAAAGRLALPVAAMAAVGTPPAFAPSDFLETCFWLERVAWPVESEPATADAAVRAEHREAIDRAVGGAAGRAVAWGLPGAAAGREVRLAHVFLVNAGFAYAAPSNPAELAQLRRVGGRADIGVILVQGGRDGVAVPLTQELAALAATLPQNAPVPVAATVERIEFAVPATGDPLHGLTRGVFRVHLTGVEVRTKK
jgi:hypothetical protein